MKLASEPKHSISTLEYLSVESARTQITKKETKGERSGLTTNSYQTSVYDTDSDSSTSVTINADK